MIEQARKDLRPISRTAQRVDMADGIRDVDLEVIPISQKDMDNPLFLVFFERPDFSRGTKTSSLHSLWKNLRALIHGYRPIADDTAEIQRLQLELDSTRQYIKTMGDEHNAAEEELKSSHEELLSSIEEFQSTNEELETAKEELQSSNEELITTNDELTHRNQELNTLNRELENARNYAQAIVETVREPLLVLDENLRIVRTNAAFHTTFKLTARETVGCLFYELADQQWNMPFLRELLSEVLPKDKAFENCEITADFPKIGKRTMMLNGRHLAWETQTLILLAIEDVTDYKAVQDELKQAATRKDEFLAMLAHELRNPLAPVRNALEIWQRGDAGAEAEREAQLIMDRQLRKETRLIDDLLDIARITQGSIALKKELIDLRQIATLAIEGTQHKYQACQHKLLVELPETEVIVEGDAIRLEQIISNLLFNAAKYTEPGGRIVLKLSVDGTKVVLRVIDNGIGIAAELLPRIFDLFVQADVSLDRAQGGLGIGLTLVRRLVELQDGTIEANSPGVNKGSEFIVLFPRAHGELKTLPEPLVKSASGNKPVVPRRILVVDDNVDSADTSAVLLQLEGHNVKAVYGGAEAIETASEFKPEVILMDIGLPGMDGYEVARRIKEGMPEASAPLIIAISGYGPMEPGTHPNGVCFDHHLMKPVDFSQLKTLVEQRIGS